MAHIKRIVGMHAVVAWMGDLKNSGQLPVRSEQVLYQKQRKSAFRKQDTAVINIAVKSSQVKGIQSTDS